MKNANIAALLPEQARTRPEQLAVLKGLRGATDYEQLTFSALDRRSDALAWGLSAYGISTGTRTLLMVPAGVPLIALTFALFKIGAAPILIDPAMGRQNLAVCIAESEPEAMIGIARAHMARLVFPHVFRTTSRFVTVGRLGWGGATLDELEQLGATLHSAYPIAHVRDDDVAAIAFTTGSTGVPKGVVYEHGMFQAQCALLHDFYGIAPGEIEMPAFPLFALFNVALGVTSAIPPIDPTRPAACDPAEVIAFIKDHSVTSTFGSPAIWAKVTAYCCDYGITLPTLQRVLMAGAPVPIAIHARFADILEPSAQTHTPYGATEALPVASISGREVLRAHAERNDPTAGTCIGWPVPNVALRIIAISDAPIAHWDDNLVLPHGQIGEIVVRGPMVTKTYLNRSQSTALAKIADHGVIWHRMGDLGYLDTQERLWFYGRKSQRVETASGRLFTEPVELVFQQHSNVFRAALVGVGGEIQNSKFKTQNSKLKMQPVVVIEPVTGKFPQSPAERDRFMRELQEIAARYPMTANIRTILFHPSFPVDIRHNAKIFREQLAVWAEKARTG